MIISGITSGDIIDLARIESGNAARPYSRQVLEDMTQNAGYVILKADNGNGIAGFIAMLLTGGEAEIHSVTVDAPYRRQGIASLLIEEAVKVCRARGARTVFLEVEETNAAAIALYLKSGFRQIAVRPRYYGDNAAIIMSRDING